MNLKLKRVAPLQAGKMLAAFYGLLSLLIIPFMLIFMSVAGMAARSRGGEVFAFPLMLGLGMGFMVVLPIVYAAIGFVFGVISAWIYNVLAGWIGGLEMEFDQTTPPPL